MRSVRVFLTAVLLLLAVQVQAATDQPATASKPAEQAHPAAATQAPDSGEFSKIPLDIQSKGTDSSGTLLSYKLKEEIIGSKLFFLQSANAPKFMLYILTDAEFPARPDLASHYTISLVYQEDSKNLSYYLEHMQGQVAPASVEDEMHKILEWTYATVKRYHYLIED